ncbi:MAG: hypothetical protein ACMUEM_03675 [Flavobacteriales bacterium AspAUS03]
MKCNEMTNPHEYAMLLKQSFYNYLYATRDKNHRHDFLHGNRWFVLINGKRIYHFGLLQTARRTL